MEYEAAERALAANLPGAAIILLHLVVVNDLIRKVAFLHEDPSYPAGLGDASKAPTYEAVLKEFKAQLQAIDTQLESKIVEKLKTIQLIDVPFAEDLDLLRRARNAAAHNLPSLASTKTALQPTHELAVHLLGHFKGVLLEEPPFYRIVEPGRMLSVIADKMKSISKSKEEKIEAIRSEYVSKIPHSFVLKFLRSFWKLSFVNVGVEAVKNRQNTLLCLSALIIQFSAEISASDFDFPLEPEVIKESLVFSALAALMLKSSFLVGKISGSDLQAFRDIVEDRGHPFAKLTIAVVDGHGAAAVRDLLERQDKMKVGQAFGRSFVPEFDRADALFRRLLGTPFDNDRKEAKRLVSIYLTDGCSWDDSSKRYSGISEPVILSLYESKDSLTEYLQLVESNVQCWSAALNCHIEALTEALRKNEIETSDYENIGSDLSKLMQ
ncbi:hypothetical protein JST97_35555 [bacterium]|nr:hypothetical protein [bacterium]